MGLRIKGASRFGHKIATLIAMFALVAQPMYGFVASQVANAAANSSEFSKVSAYYFLKDTGPTDKQYKGVGVDVSLTKVLDATAIELTLHQAGGDDVYLKDTGSGSGALNALNSSNHKTTGTFTTKGNSYTSSSWTQSGAEFVSEPTSVDVKITSDSGVYSYTGATVSTVHRYTWNDVKPAVAPSAPVNLRFTQENDAKIVEYKNDRYYLNQNHTTLGKTIGLKWDHAPKSAPGLRYIAEGYFNGVHAPSLDQTKEVVPYLGNSRVGMLGDGVYKFVVKAIDDNTDLESSSVERSITFDSTDPETTLVAPVNLAGNKFTVSGEASDNMALNRVYVQLVHRETSARYGGTTINLIPQGAGPAVWSRDYNATEMNLPEGTYAAHVQVVDRAGNRKDVGWSENFTLDKSMPSFGIVSPANGSTVRGTVSIDAEIADDSDITKVLMNIAGISRSWANGSSNTITRNGDVFSTTVDTTTLPDGPVWVSLRGTDGAGNTRYWNNNKAHRQHVFYIDNTAPVLLDVDLDTIVKSGGVNYTGVALNDGKLRVTIKTDEPLKLVGSQVLLEGFPKSEYRQTSSPWVGLKATSNTNEYYADIDLTEFTINSANGSHHNDLSGKLVENLKLRVRMVDTVGNLDSTYYAVNDEGVTVTDDIDNINDSRIYLITLDNAAPAAPTGLHRVDSEGKVVACNATVKIQSLNVAWDAYTGDDFSHYNYETLNGATRTFTTNFYDINGWMPKEGTNGVRVQTVDKAGNASEWSAWCYTTFDGTAPSLVLTGQDATDGDTLYFKTARRVHVKVTDTNIGVTKVFRDSDDVEVLTKHTFTGDNFTLDDGLPEGRYYVVHTDTAGNDSEPAYFTVANTGPAIDNFVLGEYISEHVPTSTNVAFGVSANGGTDVTGVTYKINKYDASKKNNRGAQVFSGVVGNTDYTIDLASIMDKLTDGERYVLMIQARNKADVHDTVFANFTVDNSAPVLTLGAIEQNDDGTWTINGTSDDDAPVVVTVNGKDYDATPDADGNWSVIVDEQPAGTHTLVANSTDTTGNIAVEVADSITVSEPVVESESTDVPGIAGNTGGDNNPDNKDDSADKKQPNKSIEKTTTGSNENSRSAASSAALLGGSNLFLAVTNGNDTTGDVDEDASENVETLGEDDTAEVTNSGNTDGEEEVSEGCYDFLGLCWYWWVAIVAGVAIVAYVLMRPGREDTTA